MMVKIAVIGDYDRQRPSHKATDGAIRHCAEHLKLEVQHEWIPTESLDVGAEDTLQGFDGIWCAPGSPYRSMMGAINGIQYAREHHIPFIGTCGGFQHAVLEFAKNVLGVEEMNHQEYDPDASNLFITALSCSLVGQTRKILIDRDSYIFGVYRQTQIEERYNCSFGLNPEYQRLLDEGGLKTAGIDESGEARILELVGSPFYIATLFQPQLSSTEGNPHKLVLAFLRALL